MKYFRGNEGSHARWRGEVTRGCGGGMRIGAGVYCMQNRFVQAVSSHFLGFVDELNLDPSTLALRRRD